MRAFLKNSKIPCFIVGAYEITHPYKNWWSHNLGLFPRNPTHCLWSVFTPWIYLSLYYISLLNSFLQEAKNPNLVAVPGTQMWPGIWPSSQDPLFLARVLPAHTKCLLMHQTKRWLSSSSFPIMLLEHSYYDTLLGKPLKSQGSQLKPASKGPKKWQNSFQEVYRTEISTIN